MSLIKCPECNQDLSDKAPSCPHCGYILNPKVVTTIIKEVPELNIQKIEKTNKNIKMIKAISILTIILGMSMVSGVSKNKLTNEIGVIVLALGLIMLAIAVIGNWWDRG
jgi:hypothetical protein